MNKPLTNGTITRWLLLLQEFDITIVDKLGKDNVFVDFLYRLTNNSDDLHIENDFPNEHMFVVSTHSSWYVDISNYLVPGKLPHYLSPRER
jgi:hypothetical protein